MRKKAIIIIGLSTVVVASLYVSTKYWLQLSKEESASVPELYAKCGDEYISKCENLSCIDNIQKEYAVSILKEALKRSFKITDEYFEKHFLFTNAKSRVVNGSKGNYAVVELNYLYQVSWFKSPGWSVITVLLENITKDQFEKEVYDEQISLGIKIYNIQEDQVIPWGRMEKIINSKYKGAKLSYNFCNLSNINSPYDLQGQDRGKMSVYVYGHGKVSANECVTNYVNLFNGKQTKLSGECLDFID